MSLRSKIKEGKKKLKTVVKKVGSTVKTKSQAAVKRAKEVGGFALLIPMKPILQAVLKAKGIKPSKDIEKLAQQFYENIVKRNDFDEAIRTDDGTNIFLATDSIKQTNTRHDFVDPVTVTVIVSAILKWIKETRAKKEEGKALTEAQEKALEIADKIEKEGDELVDNEIKFSIGDFFTKYWLPIVGALALAFFFARKK